MEQISYYQPSPLAQQVVQPVQQITNNFVGDYWNQNFSSQPQQTTLFNNNCINSSDNYLSNYNYNNSVGIANNNFGLNNNIQFESTEIDCLPQNSTSPPSSIILETPEAQSAQFISYGNNISQPSPASDLYYSCSPESNISSQSSIYYGSSAEQSPEPEIQLPEIEDLDLILNELETTGIDESLFIKEDEFDKLFENNIEQEQAVLPESSFVNFDSIEHQLSSINFDQQQQPIVEPETLVKRKFSTSSNNSTGSSTDYSYYSSSSPTYSEYNYYSESSSGSPLSSLSPLSRTSSISESNTIQEKKRRIRRSKHTKEERAARKKDQNKKAAERYRNKKKFELEINEHILEELEQRKQELMKQFKKIETEINVILPLANVTFKNDPIRYGQLQQLLIRLSNNNLN